MNGYLRQSTASQVRTIGAFLDDTDFKTLENALTINNTDIKIKKNGAASGDKNSGGATADGSGGLYHLTWDATDTNTVGELAFSVKVSGALVVFGTYTVLEEAAYDALYASSADPKADINVATIDADAITATAIAADAITAAKIATGAITSAKFAAGAIDAGAIAADAIGASELAADAVAEIADAVWDEAMSGHTTLGTYGQQARAHGLTGEINTGSATTTSFAVDGFTEATDDHFNGSLIVFTSGACAGQARTITDYAGGTQTITVAEALTDAPADNDDFVIVPGPQAGGTLQQKLRLLITLLNSAGQIEAGTLATDTITAAKVATDVSTEIWSAGTRTLSAPTNITSSGLAIPITGGGLVSSDVTAISTDTTAADNFETMLDGTGGQTFSLKQLNVVNTAGSAIVATSSGSGGHGIHATGDGFGSGIHGTGGSSGTGIRGSGGASAGYGLKAESNATGYEGMAAIAGNGDAAGFYAEGLIGIRARTASGTGPGISAEGNGAGPGIKATGGATGHGFQIVGGATSGDGINISVTSGNRISTDAITAATIAADAVTEIQAGLSTLTAAQVNTEVDTALADVGVTTTVTGRIDAAISSRLASTTTGSGFTAIPWNATWDAEVESEVADALESTIADSIPADGTRPSVKQALYMLTQFMVERSVASTTVTVKKADGTTSLFTLTLNDATSPTSITRAT